MFKQRTNIILLLVVILLTGCVPAQTDTPATDTTGTETNETIDNTLRIAQNQGIVSNGSLNPYSPTPFREALFMLYDRLVRADENGLPIPALAAAWEPNEDGTAWTFMLREDVNFHDGTAFTSADVAYTFNYMLDPATEATSASTFGLIESIDTPEENTVVFNLSQAHADFPLLLLEWTVRMIPEDSSDTIAETGIGTGPFILESLNAEGTTRMVANPDYWDGAPQVDALELIGIADKSAQIQALQAGQLDLVDEIDAQQAELFADDDAIIAQAFPTGLWFALEMNTETPPFDDARVRQALRLVTDRQQLVDLVLSGKGRVSCDTPVGPSDPYYLASECEQDIEQAKALLAEAGYAEGLDSTLHFSDLFSPMIPLAEVYQQQAIQAGINLELVQVPSDGYWSEVWGVEPLVVARWQQRPADGILNIAFRGGAAWNSTKWNNPAFDQLLDKARAELDLDARTELYHDAQRLMVEDSGIVIPFFIDSFRAYANSVSGVEEIIPTEVRWHIISKSE